MNRYPLWKYLLVVAVLLAGGLFAFPNLYGKDPAVQVTMRRGDLDEALVNTVRSVLEQEGIEVKATELKEGMLIARLVHREDQERAADLVDRRLGEPYTVALNLAPAAPEWLRALGAEPMVLGLDLQGGVHFLMEVDMETARRQQSQKYEGDIRSLLRDERIRPRSISPGNAAVTVGFRTAEDLEASVDLIEENFPELSSSAADDDLSVRFEISEVKLQEIADTALQQNITALRNRVNELGVAEPIIQQQGDSRIVVQLPGVQDTAEAKRILGATATLEYRAVDTEHSAQVAQSTGSIPPGTRLYRQRDGTPVLLKKNLIVSGDQLVDASAGFDPQNGQPQVNVTLNNIGAKRMFEFTRNNVNKPMAVVYVERLPVTREVDGEMVRTHRITEEVISVANILEPFGKRFRTTGLDPEEANELALFLRAGALAAPVDIIEERTVGPSLGQDNIDKGFKSVMIGFVVVLVFMAIYYRVFGLVADLALFANLVLIVALLSLIGATLTLPGIAGIVLTVGMAVDANVLIFERIREELANGNSPQTSIRAGYEKAFSTIADANVTTLIAAIVLFSFGTGPIKGFAVTLSLGIITSMFTAIMGTRAVVNLIYGRKQRVKALAI
ncbi:MAG: protein translocase subunit SecD [Xanthomonadales bacterium]|nr:protein translocase subunit SecD [Xanthomonadales bacterium]